MRYIIIGAGAVGGIIGGRLFEHGHNVLLVARGAHLSALRSGGLSLTFPEQSMVLPIPAVSGPAEMDLCREDILILAVKTQDTVAALDDWTHRPVRGGGTAGELLPVVCAQNGVENERLALRRFRQVYGMSVWLPASHIEPGAVVGYSAPLSGALQLGRYPHGDDSTAQRIAADLTASTFYARSVDDVMWWKYGKLLGNLRNAAEAICGKHPDLAPLAERAVAEGKAVLNAAQIGHADRADEPWRQQRLVQSGSVGGARRSGGSSWQSLARATGSIEADYLNGEIVLLGRTHGVATPVNAVLQRLANGFARERRLPGTLTVAELSRLVAAESSAPPSGPTV